MSDYYEGIEKEILIIQQFETKLSGKVNNDGREVEAEIEKLNGRYIFRVNTIIDLDAEDVQFNFKSECVQLAVRATIRAHRFRGNSVENWVSHYSEGSLESFTEGNFDSEKSHFIRSYYNADKDIIYQFLGCKSHFSTVVNGVTIVISSFEEYIILESVEAVSHEVFREISYSIQVALGFISGHFIQDEVYSFQYNDKERNVCSGYQYRKLRQSSSSIYHSLTHNPYGYKHFIGEEYAEQLYKSKILRPFDDASFSKLTELVHNSTQAQYAMVLFNEANASNLSLLIKNNCFYVVLEVLKKYFYEIFKVQLSSGYSSKSNIEKYKMIFSNIIPITNDDIETIKMRNSFLHGDINEIEGQEMIEIMQKQITLIYRVLLTYVGYDGYIIDHYSIRNESNELAFVKLN